MSGARIFIVEDHPLFRGALEALIERDEKLEWSGSTSSAKGALQAIEDARPDIVLLDIDLGDISGIELCRQIIVSFPGVECVMVSANSSPDVVADAVAAGAAGYVVKTDPIATTVAAIRAVADGRSFLSPTVTGPLLEQMRKGPDPDPLSSLGASERRVTEELGKGATNAEIANRLGLQEQTVKNHVSSIFRKLGVRSRVEAILFLRDRT